jgi:hypothetical protein
MIRTLACSLLLLALTASAASAAGLRLGVVGGGNQTTFSGTTPPKGKWKPRRGYQVGGSIEMTLGRNVILLAQPMFMRRSPILEIKVGTPEDPDAKETIKSEIDTITLPAMVRYAVGQNTTRFYVEGGVEVSFVQSGTLYEQDLPGQDITDLLESTDLAVDLGLGVESRLGAFTWFAGLRFTAGLVDLAKGDPIEEAAPNQTWKSRGTQFLAGISLPVLGD